MASENSSAVWYRSAGDGIRAFITKTSSSLEIAGRREEGGGISARRTFSSSLTGFRSR